jgi:hypothetical protein
MKGLSLASWPKSIVLQRKIFDMSDKKLKQILVAHPVKFATEAIKSFLQLNGINCYVLDDLNDFRYLIEDLSPQLILIHEDIYNEQKDAFLAQIEGISGVKYILINKTSQSESEAFHDQLDEPYEVGKISKILESFLD